MHGPYDKSGGADRNIYRGWNIGFFALPALLAIALIALTTIHSTLDIGSGAGRVCKHQFGAGARSGEHRATGQGNSDRQGKLTYAGLCGREVGAAFDCELDVDKPARMIHVRLRHH